MTAATAEYFAEQDLLAQWLAERCEPVRHSEVASSALYRDWQTWAGERGEQPGTGKSFSAALERFHSKRRTARFNDVMMRRVAGTLWLKNAEGQDRERIIGAAFDAMAGFAPQDEVEGMMAAQAVALHNAAMECMRRAMLPDQPFELASRMRKESANLSRAMVDMAEAIDKRRGKGQQTVRVEHVTVQAGGQAIVGVVTAPERLMGRGAE